eukprot:maker-scaffold_33-snap-gene-3.81-mRNA-1 protein AED:0.00 eAED:0.00 QI:62/0/0.5/1/0/0/2/205/293
MLPATRTLDPFDNFVPERFTFGYGPSGLESCGDPLTVFTASPKRKSNFFPQTQFDANYGKYHRPAFSSTEFCGRQYTDVFEEATFFPAKHSLKSGLKEELINYSVSKRLPFVPQVPTFHTLDPAGIPTLPKRRRIADLETENGFRVTESNDRLSSWRYLDRWRGIKLPKKRNSVTPAGLKSKLARQVEDLKKDAGETPEGQVVTKQVHKKFLVSANRYYMGSSKYKGVCWNKKKKKWRARISNKGKREFLGDWDTEVKAAMIYDARVKEIYSGSAIADIQERLNFPKGMTPTE